MQHQGIMCMHTSRASAALSSICMRSACQLYAVSSVSSPCNVIGRSGTAAGLFFVVRYMSCPRQGTQLVLCSRRATLHSSHALQWHQLFSLVASMPKAVQHAGWNIKHRAGCMAHATSEGSLFFPVMVRPAPRRLRPLCFSPLLDVSST